MATYDVVIRVEGEKDLATVIDTVHGTGKVMSTTIVAEAPEKKRKLRYLNGKRNKGISGRDLALKTLRSRPGCAVSKEEMEEVFAQHSFSRTGVAPCLSSLYREGRIEYPSPAHYKLKTGA